MENFLRGTGRPAALAAAAEDGRAAGAPLVEPGVGILNPIVLGC
jgi:hypothetical protein